MQRVLRPLRQTICAIFAHTFLAAFDPVNQRRRPRLASILAPRTRGMRRGGGGGGRERRRRRDSGSVGRGRPKTVHFAPSDSDQKNCVYVRLLFAARSLKRRRRHHRHHHPPLRRTAAVSSLTCRQRNRKERDILPRIGRPRPVQFSHSASTSIGDAEGAFPPTIMVCLPSPVLSSLDGFTLVLPIATLANPDSLFQNKRCEKEEFNEANTPLGISHN